MTSGRKLLSRVRREFSTASVAAMWVPEAEDERRKTSEQGEERVLDYERRCKVGSRG